VLDAVVLLDTHDVIWWATGDKTLSKKLKRLIQSEEPKSSSARRRPGEITTKARLGKLRWTNPGSVESYCIGQRFEFLPVTFAHAERAGSWPQDHGEPFDRMRAAQNHIEELPIDQGSKIAAFGCGPSGEVHGMRIGTRPTYEANTWAWCGSTKASWMDASVLNSNLI
jgi:PIN domain nuclease of toxin-antitoxin system